MFNKQTIKDVNVRGQTVLVRVDYNVPMKDGKITDDLRIRASLPTLELLKRKGARRIVLMSHLGRPKGEKVPELSLAPVAERLGTLMNTSSSDNAATSDNSSTPDADKKPTSVNFVADVAGPDVEAAVQKLPVGGILLLENLRFYPGEESNSHDFAREIAESTHAEIFVQDGFAVTHRAHASTDAITRELPSVAGLLVEREVTSLEKLIQSPAHPFTVIIGGAKVEDKQPLIEKFKKIADKIIVGGKIAADGYTVPDSQEVEKSHTAPDSTIYVAEDFLEGNTENLPAEYAELAGKKLDMGPISLEKTVTEVKNSKTVLWNGTLGQIEIPEFAGASTELAVTIGEKTAKDPGFTSVICGGDTTGFVENLMREHNSANADNKLEFSLISTGGGAALELLSGQPMPGIDALDQR